jgi:activating signal cointegrator complex subunit 1
LEAHQITYFDKELMEDIGGVEFDDDDEDDSMDGLGGKAGKRRREVRVVVWPGVVKRGDENGENNGLRNVVCRGKVICVED